MSVSTVMDSNLRLLRRQGILAQSEMQLHLKQAAYQLPFDQENNHLIGPGLADVFTLNDAYVTQRHTRQPHQTLFKTLSTKSYGSGKQSQGQQQQQNVKKPSTGRGKSSNRTRSSSPAPGSRSYTPKEDTCKSSQRKQDKGKKPSS